MELSDVTRTFVAVGDDVGAVVDDDDVGAAVDDVVVVDVLLRLPLL